MSPHGHKLAFEVHVDRLDARDAPDLVGHGDLAALAAHARDHVRLLLDDGAHGGPS